LRVNNEELGLREDQYREAVQKLHEQTQELEDKLVNKAHESKFQIEEVKKQNRKFEDKIKELTTSNNNEKLKKAEEFKKLRTQIKNLTDEVEHSKERNGSISQEEIKMQAESIAQEMTQKLEDDIDAQKERFEDIINKLNNELETSKIRAQEQIEAFESEKETLKQQMTIDSNKETLNAGISF